MTSMTRDLPHNEEVFTWKPMKRSALVLVALAGVFLAAVGFSCEGPRAAPAIEYLPLDSLR